MQYPSTNSFDQDHKTRLQSCLDGKPVLGPEEVVMGIINMCQLRCVTCWYWSPFLEQKPSDPNWEQQKIDKDLCFKIFDELAELKVDKLLISGQGEPFLHPHIMDIIEYAKKKFRRLSVASNGLCLDERKATNLAQILGKDDRFCISVSAASAESYATYHGSSKKAWEKLVNVLEIMSRADLEDFRLFQIINNVTCHEIEEMIHLSARLNSSLSFKFASIPKGTERFQLSPEQICQLKENIPDWQILANKLSVTVNWDVFNGQLQDEHQFPIQELGCYSGYMYSRIEADGSVYFCCRTDEIFKIGNIPEQSFRDIWFHSPQMHYCREQMREQRYFSECDSCLNWGPNYRVKQELNGIHNVQEEINTSTEETA